jgi:catechol 2,3-dioxygenase-like lactoylglutathione lyase family enzyme
MSVTFTGLGLRLWVRPDDFAAVADFYDATLGLQCLWRGDDVATYALGFGPTLVVERTEPTPSHTGLFGRATGFSLEVADIAAAYAEMTARGVPFDGPPTRQPWGATMAFFRDPAGNEHTLLQRPAV